MNRFARIGLTVLALSLGVLLAGCEGFDPTTIMESDFFNTKKRLPGERKPVFPEGTPGVTQGVPKDLVKGYQPAEQAQESKSESKSQESQPSAQAQSDEPEPKAEAKPEAKPETRSDDGARARALLEGQKPAANADAGKPATVAAADSAKPEAAGRFVVQVGSYGEATSARDMRQRVDKLGLKSYTQVGQVDGAKRIRVRGGPFAARE